MLNIFWMYSILVAVIGHHLVVVSFYGIVMSCIPVAESSFPVSRRTLVGRDIDSRLLSTTSILTRQQFYVDERKIDTDVWWFDRENRLILI